ncbi:phthiocerol/phthiodiolone dimycocerosyl transferase family protein [Roseixanthobacter liquoris]|uniref:phthiocerol/phthiodiolone dimycocerosyl transferase family protein n=1 Tax=Roseixanthobacter liquoris TaxID=3119921 RepID=UPI003726FD38
MHKDFSEATPDGQGPADRRVYREASPTELIYIATRMIVVSRSSICGTIDRAQFEAAVAHLETRYGILRSVVEDGHFVGRTDDRSAVEAWVPADRCSAETIYTQLLNADLDTGKTLYAIHVSAADDALDVFMLTSHAITDATSLIELHSCLAHMCDCVVRGEAPALGVQPFPTPVDHAVSCSLAALGTDAPPSSYSGVFAEIPMHAPHDGGAVTHRLERVVIGADAMHRIKETSHANGASVHALLLAALALAIRDVADGHPRQILMRSSVDMRRRLEPHVSPELVFTAITGHITPIPDLDRPMVEIARFIFDDIHQGLANGSIFHDYVNYPRAFGSPQQSPVAINVSDIQTVQFHWPVERLAVTGFEYALGWMKKFPNVSVSVYDGTLIANIVYVEEFAAPTTIRAISDGFVRRLASVCGQ